jgi:hypothetical protein
MNGLFIFLKLKINVMQLRKYRYLFFFIIFPFLQSCEIVTEVSADNSHRTYGGESYSSKSKDDNDFGLNMAILMAFLKNRLARPHETEALLPGNKPEPFSRLRTKDTHVRKPGEGNTFFFPVTFHPLSAAVDDYNVDGTDFMKDRGTVATAEYCRLVSPSPAARFVAKNGKIDESEKTGFMNKVGVLTGLMYVGKNSKDGNTKVRSGYLQVPVYACYFHSLENNGAVFGGVGPYFAYGIGGKIKSGGVSIKTFDKNFGFKRFDAGISVTAGYKLPMGLYFRVAYDFGLTDIDRIDVDYTKIRSFSFNIGYPIRKILKK